MEYKITVVLRFFNYEPFIKDAIETVLNQDLDGVLIKILCAKSSDRTHEICNSYAQKYDEISVYATDEEMLLSHWLEMIRTVETDIVFSLDGDDFLPENALSILYKGYLESGADMVTGRTLMRNNRGDIYIPNAHKERAEYLWGDNESIILTGKEEIAQYALKTWHYSGEPLFNANWGHIFKTKHFIEAYEEVVSIQGLQLPSDFLVFLLILRKFQKVKLINTPVYYYTIHDKPVNVASHFISNTHYVDGFYNTYNEITNFLNDHVGYEKSEASSSAAEVVSHQFFGNFIYNLRHYSFKKHKKFLQKVKECLDSDTIQMLLASYKHRKGYSRLIPWLAKYKLYRLTILVCFWRAKKRYKKIN